MSLVGTKPRAGSSNGRAILNETQVGEIIDMALEGVPTLEIASLFNISRSGISRIIAGNGWGTISVSEIRNLAVRRRKFWQRVDKSGDCWIWLGPTNKAGYGITSENSKSKLAHRVAYEEKYGTIPDGLFTCHKCDTRRCVNYDHIFLGNNTDNVRDMESKGRSKHPVGSAVGSSKLKEKEVITIKTLLNEKWLTQKQIADRFGVCKGTIESIAYRRTWKHVQTDPYDIDTDGPGF